MMTPVLAFVISGPVLAAAGLTAGSLALSRLLKHLEFLKETGLAKKSLELQGLQTKQAAIQARKEEARMSNLMREALKLRKEERLEGDIMQLLSMLQGSKDKQTQSFIASIVGMGEAGRANSQIPYSSLMGGF